jgi:hypothetical protein
MVIIIEAGTVRLRPGDYIVRTPTDWVFADNTITLTDHGYESGDGPYKLTQGTTLPTDLDETTLYWIGVVDANTFALYLNQADAVIAANDATRVTFSDGGVGDDHDVGGMNNNGLDNPLATITDGYGSVELAAPSGNKENLGLSLAAHEKLTVLADGAVTFTYWFLP